MKLPILTSENPILRQPVVEIIKGAEFLVNGKMISTQALIDNMYETLEQSPTGIGLAAPQVGISASLFIVSMEISPGMIFKQTFINPKIIDKFGPVCTMEEGCLSVPKVFKNVDRCGSILIHYYDEKWEKRHEFFHGIISRVIQHEYDHLQGILFIDL